MGTFLPGVHTSPDIWAVLAPDKIGFTMLTKRAKDWAVKYSQSDPKEVEKVLWVPVPVGSQILQDIAEGTNLNVLVDNTEETLND